MLAMLRLPPVADERHRPALPCPPGSRQPSAAWRHPLRQTVEAQVLERFAPAHVVVNGDGDVVYYLGAHRQVSRSAAGRAEPAAADDGAQRPAAGPARCLARGGRDPRDGGRAKSIAVEDDDERVQFVTLTVEPLAEPERRRAALPRPVRAVGPPRAATEALQAASGADGDGRRWNASCATRGSGCSRRSRNTRPRWRS